MLVNIRNMHASKIRNSTPRIRNNAPNSPRIGSSAPRFSIKVRVRLNFGFCFTVANIIGLLQPYIYKIKKGGE